MKKVLSVLICIAMLLTGLALAEGSELTISNPVISISEAGEESALDLSGVGLKLAAAGDDAGAGVRIALAANDQEVLSGVAAFNEQGLVLKLDGMSSSYIVSVEDIMTMLSENPEYQEMLQIMSALDFTEEDLDALIAIFETFGAQIEAGIVETGTEELDGETYTTYSFNYGEEVADGLYRGFVNLLDEHPALVSILLEDSGFATVGELYDALGMKVRMEGEGMANETESEISLSAYGTANGLEEELQLNGYAHTIVGMDEETGLVAEDATFALSEITAEGDYVGIVEINGCLTSVAETGELAGFDGYFIVPTDEENWDGVVFGLYGPAMTGTGLWLLSIGDWNETFSFDVSFGNTEGVDGAYGVMAAEGMYMSFYSETQDGVGEVGFAFGDEEFDLEVIADVAVTENDGAWMNVDTANAVNLLTITEEEIEAAGLELMMTVLNGLSELTASNETLAALVGGMMGE